jgi:hypothetical protein
MNISRLEIVLILLIIAMSYCIYSQKQHNHDIILEYSEKHKELDSLRVDLNNRINNLSAVTKSLQDKQFIFDMLAHNLNKEYNKLITGNYDDYFGGENVGGGSGCK